MEMIMIMNMLPATTSIFSRFLSHSLFGFMGISLEGLNRIMLILLLFGVVTWKRGECFVSSCDLTFGDICNPATLLLFSGVKNRKWKLCSSERFFGGCCSLWRHSFGVVAEIPIRRKWWLYRLTIYMLRLTSSRSLPRLSGSRGRYIRICWWWMVAIVFPGMSMWIMP